MADRISDVEASRRDWAIEAMRLQIELDERNAAYERLRQSAKLIADRHAAEIQPRIGAERALDAANEQLKQIAQLVAGVPGVDPMATVLSNVTAALQWIVLKSDDAYRELWRQRGLLGEAVDRG